jgi:hypothetical protein
MIFDFLAAVKISMFFFWVVTPCIPKVDTNVSVKQAVLIFNPEDGDSMFLRYIGMYL